MYFYDTVRIPPSAHGFVQHNNCEEDVESNIGFAAMPTQNGGLIDYGNLAAYSVLYMVPCVVLYAFAQKYMSQGFALGGADKG